jgi:hypothetical protein
MTTINNLSTIDSVSSGDQVPVYDESAGTARKMSVSQLMAFFSANFASPEFEVTISSPIAGFNQVLAASVQEHLASADAGGHARHGHGDAAARRRLLRWSRGAGDVDGGHHDADRCRQWRHSEWCTCRACRRWVFQAALQPAFDDVVLRRAIAWVGADGFQQHHGEHQSQMPSGGAIVGQTSGENVLGFTDTAGAVNNLRVANKATGSAPTLIAVGDDTDIGIDIQPKTREW